jgi:hypothetical protein
VGKPGERVALSVVLAGTPGKPDPHGGLYSPLQAGFAGWTYGSKKAAGAILGHRGASPLAVAVLWISAVLCRDDFAVRIPWALRGD